MLVLTRRGDDTVIFPEVGITIHFLRVRSGKVRIGVEAPQEVSIVRGELAQETPSSIRPSDENQQANTTQSTLDLQTLPRDMRHAIRNELHKISLGVHLYRELILAGKTDDAERLFEEIRPAMTRFEGVERKPAEPPATERTSLDSAGATPR